MRDASDLTERRLEAAFARIREETEANAGTLRVLVAKVSRRDVEDEEVGVLRAASLATRTHRSLLGRRFNPMRQIFELPNTAKSLAP